MNQFHLIKKSLLGNYSIRIYIIWLALGSHVTCIRQSNFFTLDLRSSFILKFKLDLVIVGGSGAKTSDLFKFTDVIFYLETHLTQINSNLFIKNFLSNQGERIFFFHSFIGNEKRQVVSIFNFAWTSNSVFYLLRCDRSHSRPFKDLWDSQVQVAVNDL